jgi:predicted ArsR family transcriptional regulator
MNRTGHPKVTERRSGPSRGEWTFLTNHARVLLAIASDPELRLRDIAAIVGITERAAVGIISDLEAAGYIRRERIGRRNRYLVDRSRPLRHPCEAHHQVGELLNALEHRLGHTAAQ